MGADSVDVFFDSLLKDVIMKRIVHMIAEDKNDEEIIDALLTRKRGDRA